MTNPDSNKQPLTSELLQRFVHLLELLQKEYRKDLSQIDKALSRLPSRQRVKVIAPGTSFGRYIKGVNAYLREQTSKASKSSLAHPNVDTGKKTDYSKEFWIRSFLRDLETCFVDKDKSEAEGAIVLKGIKNITRTFTLYFWHWEYSEVDKELQGRALAGTLLIYNDWMDARLEYSKKDGQSVVYDCQIDLRANKKFYTYYLPLKQTIEEDIRSKKSKQADQSNQGDELMLVLTARSEHPLLTGTFAGAVSGYPVMGRVMLIEHEQSNIHLPIDDIDSINSDSQPTKLRQENDELAAFARTYVSYQTTLVQSSSFASPDKIPGFLLWQSQKQLFTKPLNGYFFKTGQTDPTKFSDHRLIHFTLTVDTSLTEDQPCLAFITYYGLDGLPVNKGYLTVEQPNSNESAVVFRGGFDYLPDQHRFRYEIQFTKDEDPDSDWYFGAIMGLNHSRKQLLVGRFALRQEALDQKWIKDNELGELFQYDESLANFLMGINQQIPGGTLPLYNKLGWPHLPRPKQAMPFKSVLAGEYNCYAQVRQRMALDNKYRIACYPLKIFPSGRATMKYEKHKGIDDTEYDIIYHGRAFHDSTAGRLFLYFDKRQEGKKQDSLHLSMYFDIQPSSPITRAFGVSSRFVHTEKTPEARMEVLVSMKGEDNYNDAVYRDYNPLDTADIKILNRKEPYLAGYLSGRINRIIVPSSGLKANYNDPFPPRQITFRWLHIRAALYEIEHSVHKSSGVTECLNLIQEAYLHGFGSVVGDLAFLKKELTKAPIMNAINERTKAEQQMLKDELMHLWPSLFSQDMLFSPM